MSTGVPTMEEAMMAVLLTQDLPVGREDVEAVSAEMGAKENPPDVWESTAHYERFRDDRLMPAMGKVMAERGISMDGPPPTPEFSEAFDLITGRR
jgi:hypothetical protein